MIKQLTGSGGRRALVTWIVCFGLPLNYSPVVLSEEPGQLDAQVVPSGPSFENDNNLKLFAAVIQNAQRRISITSRRRPDRFHRHAGWAAATDLGHTRLIAFSPTSERAPRIGRQR